MESKKDKLKPKHPHFGKPLLCGVFSRIRLIGGYQNTKSNKEDFALTPYLFLVWFSGEVVKVYGIGICWGYHSFYIGIGKNVPKNINSFHVVN